MSKVSRLRATVASILLVAGTLLALPGLASADEIAALDRALDGYADNPWAALDDVRAVMVRAPDRKALAPLVEHIDARAEGDGARADGARAVKAAPEFAAFFEAAKPPPPPPPPVSCEDKCNKKSGAARFRCRVACKKDGNK